MALKCRGEGSPLNFGVDEYGDLVPMLPQLSKARLRIRDLLLHVLPQGQGSSRSGCPAIHHESGKPEMEDCQLCFLLLRWVALLFVRYAILLPQHGILSSA